MKSILKLVFPLWLLSACGNPIKNDKAVVVQENGTEIANPARTISKSDQKYNSEERKFYGTWIGYFERDDVDEHTEDEKTLYVDEAFIWNRQNKINLSIDSISRDSLVVGHSVVAGKSRPFKGTIRINGAIAEFKLKEPGDDKNDGTFSFTIIDTLLQGTWKAFRKSDIDRRKYSLKRVRFVYDPNINLVKNQRFVDWQKAKGNKYDAEMDEFSTDYASATDKIYALNASNTVLTKNDVENLKKGDLLIIRNTIYARHGYSFKYRPLRVFFDAQTWYIPVTTNIKSDFTDIEKKNIELLLRYEKNAKEYYDYFGRG